MRVRNRKLIFETLEPRELLAADPIITEFMVSNSSTLEDGNGATTDWIEIYNNGDQGVDLAGYRLTDNATDTNKWVFPSVVLGSGDFLTIFASGSNTPDSAGNLHTNFSLSASGEYLALIDPGGSVLSEFGPSGADYPAQTSDVSYGLYGLPFETDVVTPDSSARYLIPSNGAVDAMWTDHGFNDASWQMGTASIGYENSPADFADLIQTAVPTGTTSVYVRMSFTVPDSDTSLNMLQMKYDDGFIAYINGTQVASDHAPAVGEYDSFATADHPDGLAVEYVDFDLSDYSHTLNVGANTLAIHMLNRSPSSDMLSVPNLQLTLGGSIGPQVIGPLAAPTPGLPNTNLRASDVELSRVGGVFVGSFQLSMTAGPGELIRYTTDGTNPESSSPLYTGAITVNSTQQIRTRAYGPVGQVGNITTASYVNASSSVGSFTSNIPVIVLENFGQGVPDENFQDASLALYDIDPVTGRSSLAHPADFTSPIGQHRRGKSTFGQPKINFRIEIRDNYGEDKNVSLLGLPSESDWILYAPYDIDRSMVRHALMYDLSRQAGSWAPRTEYVEVYSNTNGGQLSDSDYVGVYVLMEVIKRDDNRVDIAELTATQNSEPEITGGYIIQIDEAEPNDVSWETSRGYPNRGSNEFIHVEPERIDMTNAQVDYIRGYVQDAEDALFGPNSTNPELGYQAYFDANAAIDFHIFNVFAENPDAFRLSTYLTKDRGGKLTYGPIWDFDRGMAPDNDTRSADPEIWFVDEAFYWVAEYWGKMFDDPNFEQRWVDRWQELRLTVFSDTNLQATVQSQAAGLDEAQVRNFDRWIGIAPNGGPYADSGDTGWEGEISHLANWLVARANWIDTQMISGPTFGPEPGNVSVNTPVTLSAQPGAKIYYTLDGSDPRADGGGIKSGAMLYNSSISITQTTEITARAKDTGDFFDGWSGAVTGLFSVEVPADASNLRITELQYHPANPTSAELALVPGVEDNDFEFVELLNISDDTISLNGVQFTGGITFDFTTGAVPSLAPGTIVVAVEHMEAFIARYGDAMLIAGEYSDDLSNGGDHVILSHGNNQTIHDFTYSDDSPWPTIADGSGPSLEVVDTSGNYNSSSNWRASVSSHGTPGAHAISQPGDLDLDSDIDGFDFLAWQRGIGTSFDGNDLDEWKSHFGDSIAVPISVQPGLSAKSATSSPAEVSSESSVAPLEFFSPYTISPLRSNLDETELEQTTPVDLALEQLHQPESDNFASELRSDDKYLSDDSAQSVVNDDDGQADDDSWDAAFDEALTIPLDV
jgi:CotH protein/lamin tail-like protein/Fn3 domain-containing protein/chitobiase/beta-hexosaminidase-like protein